MKRISNRKSIAAIVLVATIAILTIVVFAISKSDSVDLSRLQQPCNVLTYQDINQLMGDSNKPAGNQDNQTIDIQNGIYTASCTYSQKVAKGATSDPIKARLKVTEVYEASAADKVQKRFNDGRKANQIMDVYGVPGYWNENKSEINLLSKDKKTIYTLYYGNKAGGHTLAQTQELADSFIEKL